MSLFGSFPTVRLQAPQTPGFAAAFAYVEELLRPDSVSRRRLDGISRGNSHKTELNEGVFVIEQVYETKPRSEGFFESHRKFIDLQVIVEGEELMEVIDAAHITIREPYQAERDLITYLDTGKASALRLLAGDAAIFFPVDVHMPSLQLQSSPTLVRKAVVKIPVS